MKTELLGQEKNIVKIKVDFEAEEFASRLNEAINEIAGKVSIPGFRKGHVPRRVLEMRVGREELYNETLEKMLPNAIKQIVEDYELDTIAPPSLSVKNMHEGQPLVCELEFEISPEMTLPDFESIEVEKLRPRVTDEMVETTIQSFRKSRSTLNPVERPAGESDVVAVTCIRTLNPGEEGEVKGEEEKGDVDIADPAVAPEIKEALTGRSKGDAAVACYKFDADYEDKSMAGKDIRYDFVIDEVKERILPEMGPEFYKMMLPSDDVETEEAFREKVLEIMLKNEEERNRAAAEERAVTLLADRTEVEVPESLTYRQARFMKERDEEETKRRFNKDLKEVLEINGDTPEQYEQNLFLEARRIVRRTLVLDKAGEKFEIEVKKEDVDAELLRIAEKIGIEPARLRSMYYKDGDRMEQLTRDLFYKRVRERLMEKIRVKDVDELSVPQESAE